MRKRKPVLLRKSRRAALPFRKESLTFQAPGSGQSCPRHCPQPEEIPSAALSEPLGDPLYIKEAAALIGCSPWTVRYRYLEAGIPHYRATPKGKLIFYRNQIVRWLLRQQEKGGKNP